MELLITVIKSCSRVGIIQLIGYERHAHIAIPVQEIHLSHNMFTADGVAQLFSWAPLVSGSRDGQWGSNQ
jgi:hypothetical protein